MLLATLATWICLLAGFGVIKEQARGDGPSAAAERVTGNPTDAPGSTPVLPNDVDVLDNAARVWELERVRSPPRSDNQNPECVEWPVRKHLVV